MVKLPDFPWLGERDPRAASAWFCTALAVGFVLTGTLGYYEGGANNKICVAKAAAVAAWMKIAARATLRIIGRQRFVASQRSRQTEYHQSRTSR